MRTVFSCGLRTDDCDRPMILIPEVKSVPHAVPSPLNVSREEASAVGGDGAEGNGGEGDSAPRAD
eukprot:7233173-Prymnesium_polylepis.1